MSSTPPNSNPAVNEQARRSLLEREAQCKLDPAGTREAVRRNELGVDHAEGAGVGDVEGRVEKIGVVEDVEAVE